MENKNIKAVIFDLGNVLVDFDHMIAARKISALCARSADEIYELFFDSEVCGLFEEGKILPQDFFVRIKQMLGLEIGYAEFIRIWDDIFFLTEKNHDVYSLAKQLKVILKTALLSNINILHFEYLKEKFSVFDVFNYIITSYEVRCRKPCARIYQRAIELLAVPAENIFYTDDRRELIEGARAVGIRGYQFRGIKQLMDDLSSEGVNINVR